MPLPPLSPDQLVKPRRFEFRLSLIFAATFIAVGVQLPYFPLWLAAEGFDARQIAVILAAPMFLRVVSTPVITALADRSRDRADMLILMTAGSLAASLGYFLPSTYPLVLAISLVLAVVLTPVSPLCDSLALSGVRRFGSNYPAMRIWGSISFLAANLGGGLILAVTGVGAVPVLMSAGLAAAPRSCAGLSCPSSGRSVSASAAFSPARRCMPCRPAWC
jgi:PPP family 3-phenylpropionic acid transporter